MHGVALLTTQMTATLFFKHACPFEFEAHALNGGEQ